MSVKDQTEHVEALKTQLRDATLLEHGVVAKLNSLHSDLANVDKEIEALKLKKCDLESLLKYNEAALEDKKLVTLSLRREISAVKSSPTYGKDEAATLAKLRNTLEASRGDLETFEWQL